jgi:hypothetical protein
MINSPLSQRCFVLSLLGGAEAVRRDDGRLKMALKRLFSLGFSEKWRRQNGSFGDAGGTVRVKGQGQLLLCRPAGAH